jgi:hypothetical protein
VQSQNHWREEVEGSCAVIPVHTLVDVCHSVQWRSAQILTANRSNSRPVSICDFLFKQKSTSSKLNKEFFALEVSIHFLDMHIYVCFVCVFVRRCTHKFINTYIRSYIYTQMTCNTGGRERERVCVYMCVCVCVSVRECVFACSMPFVTLTINAPTEQRYVTELLSCSVLHSALHHWSCIHFVLKCIRLKETLGLQWRLRGNCVQRCVLLKPHNVSWLTQRSLAASRI